jgi:Cft2 family RNA processing exonuclease
LAKAAEVRTGQRPDTIETLLKVVADSLRRRRRPPSWLQKGWPPKFIVDYHRARLCAVLGEDAALRDGLRASDAVDPDVIALTSPAAFHDYVAIAADPRRGIATGLCHPDEDIVAAATAYVVGDRQIPNPPPKSEPPRASDSSAGSGDQKVLGRGKPGREPSTAATGHASDEEAPGASPPARRGYPTSEARSDAGSELTAVLGALVETANAAQAAWHAMFSEQADTRAAEAGLRADVERLQGELKDLRAQRDQEHREAVHRDRIDKAAIRKLEAKVDRLNQRVISPADRKRLEGAKRTLTESRQLRDRLTGVQAELRITREDAAAIQAAFEEAKADRDQARAQRRLLDGRLERLDWRAQYLRRALPTELARVETQVAALPNGQERTRLRQRLETLKRFGDLLDQLFPVPPEEGLPTEAPEADSGRRRSNVAVGADLALRVTPLGGATEIGGSAILVEGGRTRILVDAGLRPGATMPAEAGPARISELPGPLDAIIVTHGHADYAGYIPKLLAAGGQHRARVISSPGTHALLPTLWADSRRVMEQEANIRQRYLGTGPLYGEAEVAYAEERREALPYGRTTRVGELEITLFDAGHVLGAAGVVIAAGGHRVVVTGDIAIQPQSSVGGAQLPERLLHGADLLVIESTYCTEDHVDRAAQVAQLVAEVGEVVGRGGRVLIPAFALGRAQEIALILREHLLAVQVLVDGLARDISLIYEREGHCDIFGGKVALVNNDSRRRRMAEFTEGVVITTSGMLTGGYAVPWALTTLPDERAALFLCGYQDEESPGRKLQELATAADGKPRRLELDSLGKKETVEVRARVRTYRLSAHADRAGLLDIISRVEPRATMLVHGIPRAQRDFRQVLERVRGVHTVDNHVAWTIGS